MMGAGRRGAGRNTPSQFYQTNKKPDLNGMDSVFPNFE